MIIKPNSLTKVFSKKAAVFALAATLPLDAFSQDYPVVQMLKRNAASFAIDGNNGGDDGQDVYLWSENDSNVNQQWYEIDRGNGYYSFQKVGTDYCLDGGNGGDNGQNVYLWTCAASNQNQHWLKVSAGGDYYRLEKRNASGYSLDGNQSGDNGQSVYLWSSSSSNQNQQWLFNYLDSGGSGECDIAWSGANISINKATVNQTLEAVDIACADEVTISMTVAGVGPMEDADYINVSYRVDGGSPIIMLSETNAFGQRTVSASGVSGNTIEIVIDGYTSFGDETYSVSNIRIDTDTDTVTETLGNFEIGKDLLLCNYDGKPDEDDLLAVAGLATMLSDSRFSGVDFHCTAGAYGTQNSTFLDEPDLFDIAFGSSNWANADDNWDNAVTIAASKGIAALNDGGDIWIAEAGQSDFSADVVRTIKSELSSIDTESRIHIVQHSTWNTNNTSDDDLAYVQANTDYHKIADGNDSGNGTPGLRTYDGDQWERILADPQVSDVWEEALAAANRWFGTDWDNAHIEDGGFDFSDTVEAMWIFGFTDDSMGVTEFFDEYL